MSCFLEEGQMCLLQYVLIAGLRGYEVCSSRRSLHVIDS